MDSTASPVATVIPFNAWPLYVGGLIVGTIPLFESTGDAVTFFFTAVFGDQWSPISDTTILSALACGGDLMDHVTTQLPLALVSAALAALASTAVAMLTL